MRDPVKRAASSAAYRARHPERNKARQTAYHVANRDEHNARSAAYYVANRDAEIERRRIYTATHREERAAYAAIYRSAHRERISAEKAAAYAAHREDVIARTTAWAAAHPDRWREYKRTTGARRRGAPMCAHAECRGAGATALAWQSHPPACWMCGVPVAQGVNLHMDHVVPIARGGIHCAENLRPACATCNRRKGARVA